MGQQLVLRRAYAFTLIELLVVVAIIALLISILLPALSGARAQGKQAKCLANLDQMGKAARLYAHDNKDILVRGDEFNPAGDLTINWVASLLAGLGQPENLDELFRRVPGGQTYTEKLYHACKVNKSLQCPTFPEEQQVLDYVVNSFEIPFEVGSQTISAVVGPGPGRPNGPAEPVGYFNYSKARRTDLTRTIYITEAHQAMPVPLRTDEGMWSGNDFGVFVDVFQPNHVPFGNRPRVANDQRHPRGIVALMFDGHAEVLSLKSVDPGPPANTFDRLRRFTYDENEPR
jgi:prepilin-type N-terminal cleavage/methylation domain-containing protein/prepilin-type processing-associated H-X9-DG protein